MKLIGLLGGTSWPSTMQYYEKLNLAAQHECGGHHSARILLYSIDYHEIKSRYYGGWDEIPDLLEQEIRRIAEQKPDCLIICNNTLHRAFDAIEPQLGLSIPVFHAGHLAAEEAQKRKYRSILLLGTKFTMEDGFFARYFEQRRIEVRVPNMEERNQIQAIQSEIAKGKSDPAYGAAIASIVGRHHNADAVVLACTELPLVLNKHNSALPIINPILCQCHAAADYAFAPDAGERPEAIGKSQKIKGICHG